MTAERLRNNIITLQYLEIILNTVNVKCCAQWTFGTKFLELLRHLMQFQGE